MTKTRPPQLKAKLLQQYLRRSLELGRNVAVRTGLLRSHGDSLLRLRNRLEQANRRVAECDTLLASWQGVVRREEASGRVGASTRDMLKIFSHDLRAAISEKERTEERLKNRLRKFFVGAKGRTPYSDDELDQWLASDEGKAAIAFEPAPLPASIERRRRS